MVVVLTSNLVGPRTFSETKKKSVFFFFSSTFAPATHSTLVPYCFLSLSLPLLPLEGYPRTHLPSLWGETLETSSMDLVPHPAKRLTLMPYRSNRVK